MYKFMVAIYLNMFNTDNYSNIDAYRVNMRADQKSLYTKQPKKL